MKTKQTTPEPSRPRAEVSSASSGPLQSELSSDVSPALPPAVAGNDSISYGRTPGASATLEPDNPAVRTVDGNLLMVNLIRQEAVQGRPQPLLEHAPVTRADILPARDETWLQGIRQGDLPLELDSLELKLSPGTKHANGRIEGFNVELSCANATASRHFSVQGVQQTAQRAVRLLLARKRIELTDPVNYYLTESPQSELPELPADPPAASAGNSHSAGREVRVKRRSGALILEEDSLAKFLDASQPLAAGMAQDPWDCEVDREFFIPLFIPENVWRQGHEFARRGGDLESAGLFTGRLFRDTDSTEIFAVVEACIEAQHSSQDKFSVTFTGSTWGRVLDLLNQRRRRLNRPNEIILGSIHGHNFCPGTGQDGRRACGACPDRGDCTKTTAVTSEDDVGWHRSVFTGQPWAILGVWGYDAKDQEVWQVYGLAGTTLLPRSLHILKT